MMTERTQDRIPPQDLEMEQSVLGAMMLSNVAISRAAEILRPADFYRPEHEHIFSAILAIHERKAECDLLALQSHLRTMGLWNDTLESLGGSSYLVTVMNKVPSWVNVEYYAHQVARKATLRRLIDAANQIHTLALRGDDGEFEDVAELMTRAERTLNHVGAEQQGGAGVLAGEIGADELPDAKNIDELWFGLYPAKCTLLIGETSSGKSSALYNLAIHAARNEPLWNVHFGLGRPLRVYYVDPENAGSYRDENPEDRDGGLCRRKLDRILPTGERIPPTLKFHDGDGLNLADPQQMRRLERRILRGIKGEPFDLVVLDTLNSLFRIRKENDNAEMAAAGKACRALARRTRAAVLVVHHTGKAVEVKEIHASRGGSGLVDPFDVAMTWRRRGPSDDEIDEDYKGERRDYDGVCRLRIAKDRPSMFGETAIYLRQAGNDRFERVGFEQWRSHADGAKVSPKAGQAQPLIREILADGDFHTRADIHREIGKSGNRNIGRNSIDEALTAMVKSRELETSRMAGATVCYRLAKPISQSADFPISRFPDAVSEDNGAAELVGGFMQGLPDDPFAEDDD